jgi:hypothetical protein
MASHSSFRLVATTGTRTKHFAVSNVYRKIAAGRRLVTGSGRSNPPGRKVDWAEKDPLSPTLPVRKWGNGNGDGGRGEWSE